MHLNKKYPKKKHIFTTKVNHYTMHLPLQFFSHGCCGMLKLLVQLIKIHNILMHITNQHKNIYNIINYHTLMSFLFEILTQKH